MSIAMLINRMVMLCVNKKIVTEINEKIRQLLNKKFLDLSKKSINFESDDLYSFKRFNCALFRTPKSTRFRRVR